ncbi:MAG: hypothetical protein SF097_00625 [Acidobacteriota bacterium]|nr:hypothetical protein [Acidobacteriota bacterium]
MLGLKLRHRILVKADDDLIAFANNRTAKQVRFVDDELDELFSSRKLFGKASLFVNGVARVQKWRNRIIAENGFNLFGSQRLFSVIALGELAGVGNDFAQETPGVAAGCSGAFVEEDHFEMMNSEG